MNPLRALFVTISRIPPALMLALIVGLAVVATVAVTGELDRQKRISQAELDRLKARSEIKGTVVYAARAISEGETIASDALEERIVEQSRVPVDSITSTGAAIGRVTRFPVAAGQMLSLHDLALQGQAPGFEARLKPGMRALTFAVDANSGVSGFIAPESRVDIMGMVGSGADTRVGAVLSDVEVLAAGQIYRKLPGVSTATPVSSVTVAVSPADTQKLVKAIAASKIYLALRNDRDHTPLATIDVTSLYAGTAKAAPMAAVGLALPEPPSPPETAAAETGGSGIPLPPRHEIEVWTGGRKEVVSFVSASD